MKKIIELTEDKIKLIRNFHITYEKGDKDNKDLTPYGFQYASVDSINLFGDVNAMEYMASLLYDTNVAIPGTEEDFDGAKYPLEITNYLTGLYHDLVNNLREIEEIVHQFADKGLKVGKYYCKGCAESFQKDSGNLWLFCD